MQTNLQGKVALVTGASKGIGKAIAVKLAENGATVVINARTPEPALEVVEQIKTPGGTAIFEKGDITSYTEVKQMVANTIKKLGKIDILAVSGGPSQPRARFFMDTDPDTYMDYAKAKWFSRAYCVRAVLDHMIERQTGKIILITTEGGRIVTPGETIVGGAAAAVILMTKVIAREVARWQIRINTICTTMTTNTPGWERAEETEVGRRVLAKAVHRMPFGPNKPEDIAEAALFLASEESNQITGQILSITGGLTFPG